MLGGADADADALTPVPDVTDGTVRSAPLVAPTTLAELVSTLGRRLHVILGSAVLAAAAAFGVGQLLPPLYTSVTTLLPPAAQQPSALGALAGLSQLAGLSAGLGAARSVPDQYVSFMQSALVSDRIIDRFHLAAVYGKSRRVEMRRALSQRVRMSVGRKDGIVTVEVDDEDPRRAAAIANQYVAELSGLVGRFTLTEAQARRKFFESRLEETRRRLSQAQRELQGSGFDERTLRSDPKAAAETYAKVGAAVAAAEVRLERLRRSLSDDTPEVRQQQAELQALSGQLARVERPGGGSTPAATAAYVDRYREFKYQETLFEVYARQFELARLDESREGSELQVIDVASPPDLPSKPKPLVLAALAFAIAALAAAVWVLRRRPGQRPSGPR